MTLANHIEINTPKSLTPRDPNELVDDFWLKQNDKALFPDAIWSRPEQKAQAKRLLIIGGHSAGFEQVGRLYQAAIGAGIGETKVILPASLKRVIGNHLPDTVFADLTPDATDAASAINELLSYTDWADGVIFVQTGHNSQTALLLAHFVERYIGHLIVSDDLLEVLKQDPDLLAKRQNTLFVLSFAGLQALVKQVGSEIALRQDMGLRPFVLALRQLNEQIIAPLNVVYEQSVVTALGGQVVSTPRQLKPDPIMLSAYCATWWLQQPQQPLAALANAVLEF